MSTRSYGIIAMIMLVGIASATVDTIASVPFTGNNASQGFMLVDQTVPGCPHSTSAILYLNGTVYQCMNQTLVDDQSYMTGATGFTLSGLVQTTGSAWFKRLESPIAGLDPVFALFIALGIMMMTAMMAGITTGPAVSLCFSFEGWVFYSMNMFTLIDHGIPAGGSVVVAILTVTTLVSILWLAVEYRRKNK